MRAHAWFVCVCLHLRNLLEILISAGKQLVEETVFADKCEVEAGVEAGRHERRERSKASGLGTQNRENHNIIMTKFCSM